MKTSESVLSCVGRRGRAWPGQLDRSRVRTDGRHGRHDDGGGRRRRLAAHQADRALEGNIHRADPDFGSTLTVSSRDYQSNCWANWKIMGQPCEFQVSGVALKLRLAGEAGAEVKVRVVAAASGQLLASGIAKPTMAESSSGTSEEVVAVWSGKSSEVALAAAASQGDSVMVELDYRGGASVFSFAFE